VIGFDTVEECIDQCRYYLAHDRERREIAAAGWARATRDYTEVPIFQRVVDTLSEMLPPERSPERSIPDIVARQRKATRLRRLLHPLARGVELALKIPKAVARRIFRR